MNDVIDFMVWCNTPIYRPPDSLGFILRVTPIFPDYSQYVIINDKGKNIFKDNKFLSKNEVYEYWLKNIKTKKILFEYSNLNLVEETNKNIPFSGLSNNDKKNLEDCEILSDEMFKAISYIAKTIPDVVFGGSIAFNALGLINRKISDIDLFFNENDSLSKNGFLNMKENDVEIGSDTVTDVNGKIVQRTSTKILGIKTCCFKVDAEQLLSTKHKFNRNGDEITINIQNINKAIEAKRAYATKNPKHLNDLNSIESYLNELNNNDVETVINKLINNEHEKS